MRFFRRSQRYFILSVYYYWTCIEIKILAFYFTLSFIIRNRRLPRKLSREEFEELKRLADELREKDSKG